MKYVASREDGFRPHWVFTGSDDVLRNLVLDKGLAMTRELDALLRGESITRSTSCCARSIPIRTPCGPCC